MQRTGNRKALCLVSSSPARSLPFSAAHSVSRRIRSGVVGSPRMASTEPRLVYSHPYSVPSPLLLAGLSATLLANRKRDRGDGLLLPTLGYEETMTSASNLLLSSSLALRELAATL